MAKIFKNDDDTIWLNNYLHSNQSHWPPFEEKSYVEVLISMNDFFEMIQRDPKESGYFYMSGEVSDFDSPDLLADVSPSDFFSPTKVRRSTLYSYFSMLIP